MKVIKYVLAGALMMGLSAPVMAQEISYQDKLKPIENVLKTNAGDAKALKDLTKDYQKEFKKNPKALVALGELFAMNKKFAEAEAVANMAISRDKSCGAAYILLGDIDIMTLLINRLSQRNLWLAWNIKDIHFMFIQRLQSPRLKRQ